MGLVGSDGAHSTVRKSLGFEIISDSSGAVWESWIFPHTNFPDIRKKCPIDSDSENILVIPREGDEMVRSSCPWSAYGIGQRQANRSTKDLRVFLTGGTCHAHSPKAGQGMNISLQYGHNLGWKLGYLLSGRASPDILETYVSERQATAKDLDFDRYFTKLFSANYRHENHITANDLKDQFVKAGRNTAGLATKYGPSMPTRPTNDSSQIALKLIVGMRFPSSLVVRVYDSRPVHLSRGLPSDGRWHWVVFTGDVASNGAKARLDQLAADVAQITGRYAPEAVRSDGIINAILVLSFQSGPDIETPPELFTPKPATCKWSVHTRLSTLNLQRDTNKMFEGRTNVFIDKESYYNVSCGQTFQSYGIGKSRGAVVILGPDLSTRP
ncbi:FAD binding domain-containing protein [Dactylonectria estremocensis]|uniref:FAD binding domain-containing protein n=1 Tax=Dactylonectria estremocensis TaxID=1079267 RepID=A0A9P9IPI1_9HYPO|nr:FAD binding domain-containing protein [Dactylonectria estremocensis]